MKYALRKEAPGLVEEYERIMTLTGEERESALQTFQKHIYRISQGFFQIWGLNTAINTGRAPYFGGSHINVLMKVFPEAGLDRLGFGRFGLDWTTL